MTTLAQRNEALLMLDRRGAILDVAREVSGVMARAGIDGAVIGGVAVVLHGHIRTTLDVDVFTPEPTKALADALRDEGFKFSAARREFSKHGVAVHLVTLAQIGTPPIERLDIEEIRTVGLADLVNLKLRSGSENIVRAQDLADVIGLIRARKLTGEFARHLDKDLRPAFRKLSRAVRETR